MSDAPMLTAEQQAALESLKQSIKECHRVGLPIYDNFPELIVDAEVPKQGDHINLVSGD